MTTPSPQLSREEQLAFWLEKKKKQGKQKRNSSGTPLSTITLSSYQTPRSLGSARRLSNKSYTNASSQNTENSAASKSFGGAVQLPRPYIIKSRSPYVAARSSVTSSQQQHPTGSSSSSSLRPSFVTSRRRPPSTLGKGEVARGERRSGSLEERGSLVAQRKLEGSVDAKGDDMSTRQRLSDSENEDANVPLGRSAASSGPKSTLAATMGSKETSAKSPSTDSCTGGHAMLADDLIGMVVSLENREVPSPLSVVSSKRTQSHESSAESTRKSVTRKDEWVQGAPGTEKGVAIDEERIESFAAEQTSSGSFDDDEGELDWRNEVLNDEPTRRKCHQRRKDSIFGQAPPAASALEDSPRNESEEKQSSSASEISTAEDTEAEELLEVPNEVLRINDRAILESIPEFSCKRDPVESSKESAALRSQINSLRIENKRLEGHLQVIRRSYDQRVTPFRDLFDEMRKLREVNENLRKQKEESDASVQQIVNDLKAQMMTGLTAAVAKTQALQKQLSEALSEKAKLERLLSTNAVS